VTLLVVYLYKQYIIFILIKIVSFVIFLKIYTSDITYNILILSLFVQNKISVKISGISVLIIFVI